VYLSTKKSLDGLGSRMMWVSLGAFVASAFTLLVFAGFDLVADGPTGGPPPGEMEPAVPLAKGIPMSLGQATVVFPLPVYRPESVWGADSTIEGLWVRSDDDSPEVYIEYRSGLVVFVRPSRGLQSTSEYAEAQIADGVPGEVIEILGVDAFLVPRVPDHGWGSVRLVLNGAVVTAVGYGDFSVTDLRAIGESIVRNAPAIESEHRAR
jgi:hypothetical protein